MRGPILYLVPDLFSAPGGIARHGRTICSALSVSGVPFVVVALHDDGSRVDSSFYFQPDAYHPCRGRKWTFAWRALISGSGRPALVLVEHPHFSLLGWALARLWAVPLLVVAHGVEIWEPLPPLRKWAIRHAEAVICVSHVTARRAATANGIGPDRLHILHNCLDPSFTSQREVPEEQHDEPSILTVSRLSGSEGYKGHAQVIQVLPRLLSEFPRLVYDIVGEGCGRKALEELASAYGVQESVRFHGALSDSDLYQRYARSWIFVMPSRSEGFGIVFLEAMAYRKPVIAGNADAAVEVIEDGETGFLVDPSNLTDLTAKIECLLGDRDLRMRMGLKGAVRVRERFSFEVFQRVLIALLEPWAGRQV